MYVSVTLLLSGNLDNPLLRCSWRSCYWFILAVYILSFSFLFFYLLLSEMFVSQISLFVQARFFAPENAKPLVDRYSRQWLLVRLPSCWWNYTTCCLWNYDFNLGTIIEYSGMLWAFYFPLVECKHCNFMIFLSLTYKYTHRYIHFQEPDAFKATASTITAFLGSICNLLPLLEA